MTYRRGPEYQPTIGAGKKFAVVAGLAFTAACSAEIQASPTAEIFPTQPQATEIVPTPSPIDRIGDKIAELSAQTITPPEVERVEEYEGIWYGIDENDRAIVKLQGNEWVNYQRPITWIYREHEHKPNLLTALSEPLDSNEEMRLVDGSGNLIPYGILHEQAYGDSEQRREVVISGLVRGAVKESVKDSHDWSWAIIEVPLRYDRLIIIGLIPDNPDMSMFCGSCYAVPASGNIDQAVRQGINYQDFADALATHPQGEQIVVSFMYEDKLNPLPWHETAKELVTALQDGEAPNNDLRLAVTLAEFWVSEELFRITSP